MRRQEGMSAAQSSAGAGISRGTAESRVRSSRTADLRKQTLSRGNKTDPNIETAHAGTPRSVCQGFNYLSLNKSFFPTFVEVERASRHVKLHAQNKRIQKVDVFEDSIVFSGTSHTDFVSHVSFYNQRSIVEML